MFASERDINPSEPSVCQILDFFTDFFEPGLGYSGINTARSASSAVLTTVSWTTEVGKHPLIRRFVKAVYQIKPVFPKY